MTKEGRERLKTLRGRQVKGFERNLGTRKIPA